MKTAIRDRVLVLKAALCVVAAGLADSSAHSLAAEPESSPKPPHEILLAHRVLPAAVANWRLNYTPSSEAFAKEPITAQRKVIRGALELGGESEQAVAFLWNYREGKLHLDLNGNRDLTDDAEGAFSCRVSSFSYYSQVFTNVHLGLKGPAGTVPLCVDLHLYNPEAPKFYGLAMCRSLWEGKISLGGHDWQVGRLDNEPRSVGRGDRGFLLLRPWAERDHPLDLQSGALDAFSFAPHLFFAGEAYRLACEAVDHEGKPKYKLSLWETTPEMGELHVTGKSIHRLALAPPSGSQTENGFQVVLEKPEGKVKVPVGNYGQAQVQLRSGKVNYCRELYGQPASHHSVRVAAASAEAPVLSAGGPLTNSVFAQRRGRNLSLQYQLLGADGARYRVVNQDRSHPPQFVISKDGKPIHSGAFEFG